MIEWTPFDAWTPGATSGSVTYKGGSVEITLTSGPAGFSRIDGAATNRFATTSSAYENIDTTTHNVFNVSPVRVMSGGNDWSIELDFVGTSVTSDDVFTIGQLFIFGGVPSTTMTISAFAADDNTLFDLTDLAFEQHALDAANFDGPLDWNATTGVLSPTAAGNGQNSRFGFFSPTSGEIGRLVLGAATPFGGTSDLIQFGLGVPVPEPRGALLLGLGIGLALLRRHHARLGRPLRSPSG